MSEERLRTAHKLIQQGRYHVARDILREMDHPIAQAWLQQIENKQSKPPKREVNWVLPLMIVGAIIGISVLVVFLTIRPIPTGLSVFDALPEDIPLSEQDEFYLEMMHYCTQRVGYGVELCMDWTEMVVAEHQSKAVACLEEAQNRREWQETMHACIINTDIPPPF